MPYIVRRYIGIVDNYKERRSRTVKNVKKVLVVFMATLFLSGIVAASAETFSFYIPEYGAASSSFIYKEMNVSKANVAVTSATHLQAGVIQWLVTGILIGRKDVAGLPAQSSDI